MNDQGAGPRVAVHHLTGNLQGRLRPVGIQINPAQENPILGTVRVPSPGFPGQFQGAFLVAAGLSRLDLPTEFSLEGCGEQDMLEGYVIAKLWDDPTQDVNALLDEFFRLYFGAAAKPMKKFYLALEKIATNPKNYPRPYYRRNGIDWRLLRRPRWQ